MSRLRPVEARRLVAFLLKQGFVRVGQTGSHCKLRRDAVLVVIPVHARHPVKAGIVLRVLKQAGVDPHKAMEEL